MSSPEETNTGPVIRNLRRIDPATGQVRDPGQERPAGAGPAGPDAPQRGPGKSRPGRHAASKPGGTSSGRPAPGDREPAAGTGPAPGAPPAPGRAAGTPEGEPATPPPPGAGNGTAGAPSQGAGDGTAPAAAPAPAPVADAALAEKLAERTADLQRVTAEYANYRKRVERDRLAVREQALSNVLSGLLPVLDDIGRAREHGELVGGFKSVADSLESSVTKLGLTSFGEAGEAFDPNVHEALMHSYSPDVTETTCAAILQPGYRVGERILRPARVAVAEPGGEGGDGGDGAEPGPEAPAGTAGHSGGPGAEQGGESQAAGAGPAEQSAGRQGSGADDD